MSNTFIEMIKQMRRKNKARFYEAFYKEQKVPQWHIYQTGEEKGYSYKDINKRFQFIHFGFKYKLVVPLLMWAESLIKKCKIPEVPKTAYNTNLRIFDEVVEDSVEQWVKKYINRKPTERQKYFLANGLGPRMIRAAKNAFKMIYLYDTAYREFMNVFMYNIAKRMNEEYRDKPEVNHVFFPSANFADMNYYVITKQLGQGKIQMENVDGDPLVKKKSNESNKQDNTGTRKKNSKKV